MKRVNIFLVICALSTVALMTYMAKLNDATHDTDIVSSTADDAPDRKSWPPAAWWKAISRPRSGPGTTQRYVNDGNASTPSAAPTDLPENSTADVIPPIEFDVNSTTNSSSSQHDANIAYPTLVRLTQRTSCARQNNVVFIKTHKTGSTSLSHIVNRYGLHYNLSFVFNKLSPGNGHLVYLPLDADTPRTHFLPPIGVRPGDFAKYKYNMLAVHVRYNRKAMDSFMSANTHYITIIRDPATQFESAFTHFQLDDSFNADEKRKYTTMESRLAHFFTRPDYYRQRLKHMKWENKMGLRWYYARNNQIFDMGLDHVYHGDKGKVQEYIKKLDREFRLVLITEYFEESLVILKRTMCWDTEDILYVAKNVRPHPANIQASLRLKMRNWNEIDSQLYDRFNRSLWEKIREYGPSFSRDLAEFRKRLKDTFDECVGEKEVKKQGHYFHWIEYKPRKDSSGVCSLIAESKKTLFNAIWKRQAPKKPIQLPSYRQQFRPGAMNWHRYPPLNNANRPRTKQVVPPVAKTVAKTVAKPVVKSPTPEKSNPAGGGFRPPPPKPQFHPPKTPVIKHVSANSPSKSRTTANDPGDGEDSSSVVVIREGANHQTADQSKEKTLSNSKTSGGTKVSAVVTYKKNQ